jgi:hypothetical protein
MQWKKLKVGSNVVHELQAEEWNIAAESWQADEDGGRALRRPGLTEET